jgi:small subunit ribosomal protein S3
MGHKVNPISFRLQVNKNWKSRWFATADYSKFLHEDLKIRKYINEKLGAKAGISKVEIERNANMVTVIIHTSRPGVIIGRGGAGATELKAGLTKLIESKIKDINIEEIRNAELDAQVMADAVAQQLEKRIAYKRAAKQILDKIMKAGAKGAKIMIGGRLNGADISRSQFFAEGKIPLATLRADIDYAQARAWTTYGILGVKVWIYKGEVVEENKKSTDNMNIGLGV